MPICILAYYARVGLGGGDYVESYVRIRWILKKCTNTKDRLWLPFPGAYES